MNEMATWARDWQTLGETAWTTRLPRRVQRDARNLRREVAGQLLAMGFSSTLVSVLAWSLPRPEVLALAGIVLTFNAVTLLGNVRERARLLSAVGTGTEAFVELTRRRLDSALRTAQTARRTTWGLAAALAPACLLVYVQNADRYRQNPWSAVLGFGTIVVALALVLARAPQREARLAGELDSFVRELEDARGHHS